MNTGLLVEIGGLGESLKLKIETARDVSAELEIPDAVTNIETEFSESVLSLPLFRAPAGLLGCHSHFQEQAFNSANSDSFPSHTL